MRQYRRSAVVTDPVDREGGDTGSPPRTVAPRSVQGCHTDTSVMDPVVDSNVSSIHSATVESADASSTV